MASSEYTGVSRILARTVRIVTRRCFFLVVPLSFKNFFFLRKQHFKSSPASPHAPSFAGPVHVRVPDAPFHSPPLSRRASCSAD